ncbi:MAG: bifunctional pyr operon transcriptional regulator/uracil phosphoribosyltransferase PyrR [Candidatus Omnitrophica bacterium]|nr:bifunctional pyr operon transcriptional regulator/uracil phosphoribosyltransferase PyrR [Candidatus Omnitrophota bacterium]
MSELKVKAKILDKDSMQRILKRLAHEIIEKNSQCKDNLCLIGIRTRGVYVAERINSEIEKIIGVKLPFGILDITLYRDDLTLVGPSPIVRKTQIDFGLEDKKVILVDDVLFSGRTIRAAMDELIDFGRPKVIGLAVLIDRGHRELPIRADYVGKNIPTSLQEIVEVRLEEIDAKDEVVVVEKKAG